MADRPQISISWETILIAGPFIAGASVLGTSFGVAISDSSATGTIAGIVLYDTILPFIISGWVMLMFHPKNGQITWTVKPTWSAKTGRTPILLLKSAACLLAMSPAIQSADLAIKTIHYLPIIGLSQNAQNRCVMSKEAIEDPLNSYDPNLSKTTNWVYVYWPPNITQSYQSIIDRCKAVVPKPLPNK
ncbi:hypothetical protein [Thalassospira mesophila]|nr:hypothetical protein [Thalassospira mesophila]